MSLDGFLRFLQSLISMNRMCHYEGGREATKRLAEEWRAAYPTRRVMVKELTEFIDQL